MHEPPFHRPITPRQEVRRKSVGGRVERSIDMRLSAINDIKMDVVGFGNLPPSGQAIGSRRIGHDDRFNDGVQRSLALLDIGLNT